MSTLTNFIVLAIAKSGKTCVVGVENSEPVDDGNSMAFSIRNKLWKACTAVKTNLVSTSQIVKNGKTYDLYDDTTNSMLDLCSYFITVQAVIGTMESFFSCAGSCTHELLGWQMIQETEETFWEKTSTFEKFLDDVIIPNQPKAIMLKKAKK